MSLFQTILAVAALLVGGYWIRHFWLLTHRIAVARNGICLRFAILEIAAVIASEELDKIKKGGLKLAPIEQDDGFIELRTLGKDGNVLTRISFTGPETLIYMLQGRIMKDVEHNGLTPRS